MIPRFDLDFLRKSEKGRADFTLALTNRLARFYFTDTGKTYLVRATPSKMYFDMMLKAGYLVSLFLVPFPPFIRAVKTKQDQEQVANYQKAAFALMGIQSQGLFKGNQLNYPAYYKRIRGYDGATIRLSHPLSFYTKKLLPPLSDPGTGLVLSGGRPGVTLGVQPALVWGAWDNPELYSLGHGLELPKFEKLEDLEYFTGEMEDGKKKLAKVDAIIHSILLEEIT